MRKAICILCSLVLVSCNLKSPDNSKAAEKTVAIQSDSVPPDSTEIPEEETIMQDSIELLHEDIKFIPPIVIIDEEEYPQGQQRTILSRTITVRILSDEYTDTEIYYYSPRMESKDYSYRKELGSDNNFVGLTDIDNSDRIEIPDTCELGAKLIFHTVGYELVEIDMNNIAGENHVEIELTPVIYNSYVFLESNCVREREIINTIDFDELSKKVFYGKCLPIYDGYGGHADPICAFRCMGCTPHFKLFTYEISQEEKKALYKALSEGERCSFLITVDKGQITDIEIEEFPTEDLPELRQAILGEQWRLDHNGRKLQVRVHFAINGKQIKDEN